jgi:hypothetical protein
MRLRISATPPPLKVEFMFWIIFPESLLASSLNSSIVLRPTMGS